MDAIQKNYSNVILEKVPISNKTALYSYGTMEFNSFQEAAYYIANNKEIAASIDNLWQRYVLNMFYYRTNGDGWVKSDNWLSQSHHCGWRWMFYENFVEGVSCNEEGEVEALNLPGNKLVGRIPMELGKYDDDNHFSFLSRENFLLTKYPTL